MLSLCDVCSSGFASRQRSGNHHRSVQALESAAGDGCYLCMAINVAFSRERHSVQAKKKFFFLYRIMGRHHGRDHKMYRQGTYDALSHESYCIIIWWAYTGISENEPFTSNIAVDLVPTEQVELESLSNAELAASYRAYKLKDNRGEGGTLQHAYLPLLTKDALPLASQWLEACRSDHSTCAARQDPTWKPKRLLHCRDEIVRLVETKYEQVTRPYAAVSHCWGAEKDFLVLKTTNAKRLQSGILQSSLPNNFRDVISVAKELGIEYVWVDCLCILQSGEGSADDWRLHASDMTNVYENCVLTIATHSAESPTHHSLIRRAVRLIQEPCIVWHGFCQATTIYNVFLRHLDGHNALLSSPLSARAWAFQERLLAPRLLHIGSSQLFWECRELPLATECFPSGIPEAARDFWSRRPFSLEKREHRARREDDGHSVCPPLHNDAWKWLVTIYSGCALTYPLKDKLVALAGITRRLCDIWSDVYVCGFFKSDLSWHLLWTRSREETKRWQGPYIAPSWSWLCMDGAVTMPDYREATDVQLLVRVQGVEVQLVDPTNPWGVIRSASLTLSGLLLPIKLHLAPNNNNVAYATFPQHHSDWSNCFLDTNNAEISTCSGDMYAIFVFIHQQRSSRHKAEGLLLQLSPNRQEFQRIGVFGTTGLSPKDLEGWHNDYRNVKII